jgi:hypothetical protein
MHSQIRHTNWSQQVTDLTRVNEKNILPWVDERFSSLWESATD